MVELTDFLRAQLDQDEQAARDAPHELDSGEWPFWRDVDDKSDADATDAYRDRFPPNRVLRETEAKRDLVLLYQEAAAAIGKGTVAVMAAAVVRRDTLHRVLATLAAAWKDHPDYREEWRP